MSARRWSLVIARGGDEVRVSLHPVSLARVLAEVIDDAATAWCRRRGHDAPPDGHCARCGMSLPDSGGYAWLPTAIRAVTRGGTR